MKKLDLLEKLNSHSGIAYSIIRIFLGGALVVRGLIFFSDPAAIIQIAGANKWYWWYSYMIVSHLIGGLMLAVGSMTRFAAILQIPILIGAVFVIHLKEGLLKHGQSLELSALVLILLITIFIFGAGELSIDYYLRKKRYNGKEREQNDDLRIINVR